MSLAAWLSSLVFRSVHGSNLVYNQCWEDPRLDRVALDLGPDDNVMVITSAGCNALDYALCGPRCVNAVDVNPRQNALLELKLAGIRALDYEDFFQLFGRGNLPNFHSVFREKLRPRLSPAARQFWSRCTHYFTERGRRRSFYFHGTSGLFAWLMNIYLDTVADVRHWVDAALDADTLEKQSALYYNHIAEAVFSGFIRWLVGRDALLAMLGVPRQQRMQLEQYYHGGIATFIEDCLRAVFAELPLSDNYFWRVYLRGEYTQDCCPEYLTREGFERLKGGLADRVQVHRNTVQGFLERTREPITRFVLLDHMDWLSAQDEPLLQQEWQAIVDRAAPNARAIWRSGAVKVDFIDSIEVTVRGRKQRAGDLLTYHPELAAELHAKDRVHTYGSFYIADFATA